MTVQVVAQKIHLLKLVGLILSSGQGWIRSCKITALCAFRILFLCVGTDTNFPLMYAVFQIMLEHLLL